MTVPEDLPEMLDSALDEALRLIEDSESHETGPEITIEMVMALARVLNALEAMAHEDPKSVMQPWLH